MSVGMPQGQYSRIENGKVMPTIPTLEKIAEVFEVSIVEFFKTNSEEDTVNLPLLEKIKIIDTLEADEKEALLKLIDMAVSKKKLKDNLSIIASINNIELLYLKTLLSIKHLLGLNLLNLPFLL